MKGKEKFSRKKQTARHSSRWWSGLQAHMTFSYVGVTVGSVLFLEILVTLALIFGVYSALLAPLLEPLLRQNAVQYALVASAQAKDGRLNPQTTFLPNRPNSLALVHAEVSAGRTPDIQYIATRYPDSQPQAFALLIAPDGTVMASSYPVRYPAHVSVLTLFPGRADAVTRALSGTVGSGTRTIRHEPVTYASAPVWGSDTKIIGAVYIEFPSSSLYTNHFALWRALEVPAVSALVLLLITVPIGGLFGAITTRGLVRRIHTLATATTSFADGDYAQHVRVGGKDEVGQLEIQFNRMAEQLIESISRRQELAEQNARLGERDRISRELHDAVSQDLFSLHMLAGGLQTAFPADSPLYPQIVMLKETAQTMIFEMRALLLELRPAQLAHLGLPAALEDLATAYRSRLGIEVLTTIQAGTLSPRVEHAILRIAQEALSNAARHAEATTITLALQPQGTKITLTITDNGEGFEQETVDERHGLGLHTMQERVQELHGTFELISVPGQGTRIFISLPREEEERS